MRTFQNKRFSHVFLVAALVCIAPLRAFAEPANRLVLQVSDNSPVVWNQTLNNARNVQQLLGKDNVAIEIVVYGQGIGMVKFDSPSGELVGKAIDNGVDVVVCENTLRAQKLTKEDMLDKVKYTPAGVVAIMNRQKQGWSYIKP